MTDIPTYTQIVDQQGKATVPWTLFFESVAFGDAGLEWLPVFQNLTVSGTPTVTGKYFRLSKQICVFWVHVVPATNTSSTAGSTYIENFPLANSQNGFCVAVSGGTAAAGMIDATSNRIYTPAWTTVTIPLTVIGLAFAS